MKCEYFRKDIEDYYSYDSSGRPIRGERTIGICLGTKEMEQCFCEGDKNHCSLVRVNPVKTNYQRLLELSEKEMVNLLTDFSLQCYIKGLSDAGETISFEEKEDVAKELSELLLVWLNEKGISI